MRRPRGSSARRRRTAADPLPVSTCCGSKIRYQAPTDLVYTVGTFNLTYGVTDDLDVNVAVLIATLDMDLDVTRQDTPRSAVRRATAQESSANISDMLVRDKYRLLDTTWALGTAVAAAGCACASRRGWRCRGACSAGASSRACARRRLVAPPSLTNSI